MAILHKHAKVPFAKLPGLLIKQARAFVINPMGFNLILDREQLGRILGVKIPPVAVAPVPQEKPAEVPEATENTQAPENTEAQPKTEE